MDAAGLDSSEAAAKVKYWQGVQKDFIVQTDLKRQYGRENIGIPVASFGMDGYNKDKQAVWQKIVKHAAE